MQGILPDESRAPIGKTSTHREYEVLTRDKPSLLARLASLLHLNFSGQFFYGLNPGRSTRLAM